MTEAIVLALIAGVPGTLAATAALIVSIRNSQKATLSLEKTTASLEKTEETAKKTDEIHVLVNSNLTAVKADLAIALGQIEKLEKLLMDLMKGKEKVEEKKSGHAK